MNAGRWIAAGIGLAAVGAAAVYAQYRQTEQPDFALVSAMRVGEICRITFEDVNWERQTITIRDRKDPQQKIGNNQVVPLLPAAIATLRTNRSRPIRFTGDPEKKVRNAESSSCSRNESGGSFRSSRAFSFISEAAAANLFHGQADRQSSQP